MSFNQAAINTLVGNIKAGCTQLGVFQQVLSHEPKSAPQHDKTLAFWWTDIKPSTHFSDFVNTAGVVIFQHRIYIGMLTKPEDQVEADLMNATSKLIGEYSGEFSFGHSVINVDLLGIEGTTLSARTGYVEIDKRLFRTSNITVPVIIDALWTQTP